MGQNSSAPLKPLKKFDIEIICSKLQQHINILRNKKINDLCQKEKLLVEKIKVKQISHNDVVFEIRALVNLMKVINASKLLIKYLQILKENSLQIANATNNRNYQLIKNLIPYLEGILFGCEKLNIKEVTEYDHVLKEQFTKKLYDELYNYLYVDIELAKNFNSIEPLEQEVQDYLQKILQRYNITDYQGLRKKSTQLLDQQGKVQVEQKDEYKKKETQGKQMNDKLNLQKQKTEECNLKNDQIQNDFKLDLKQENGEQSINQLNNQDVLKSQPIDQKNQQQKQEDPSKTNKLGKQASQEKQQNKEDKNLFGLDFSKKPLQPDESVNMYDIIYKKQQQENFLKKKEEKKNVEQKEKEQKSEKENKVLQKGESYDNINEQSVDDLINSLKVSLSQEINEGEQNFEKKNQEQQNEIKKSKEIKNDQWETIINDIMKNNP